MPNTVKLVQSADGTRIYADAVGEPANPAVVFAHGFFCSAAAFDLIFSNPENSKEFFLVRYDVRGHGRSGRPTSPEGYSSQRFAEDFHSVCKAFAVKKPIFVGWSMGARIITDIATYLPFDTLRAAVCLAGPPYVDPKTQATISLTFNSIVSVFASSNDIANQQKANIAAIRLLFLKNPVPSASFLQETIAAIADGADFVRDNQDVAWKTRCEFVGFAMHMLPQDRAFYGLRQQDNARVFKLLKGGFPILLVHGTHDAYISSEKLVETLRPEIANLKVKMIEGASHASFVEKPDEVMKAIMEFAKGIAE